MSTDLPNTEYRLGFAFAGGGLFSLFDRHLSYRSPSEIEHMPLAAIGSVRVRFDFDLGKVRWAIIWAVVAAIVFVMAAPVGSLAARASAEMASQLGANASGSQPALGSILHSTFQAIESLAGMLPKIGRWLMWLAGALFVIGAIGTTTLSIVVGATERNYVLRGLRRSMFRFAATLSEQLARLTR